MGEVIPLFPTARPLLSGPWDPIERAALDAFAARAAEQAPWGVQAVIGLAEGGEPWMALCCARTGETLVHFARVGGRYIALDPDGVTRVQGGDLHDLLRRVPATGSEAAGWQGWPLPFAALAALMLGEDAVAAPGSASPDDAPRAAGQPEAAAPLDAGPEAAPLGATEALAVAVGVSLAATEPVAEPRPRQAEASLEAAPGEPADAPAAGAGIGPSHADAGPEPAPLRPDGPPLGMAVAPAPRAALAGNETLAGGAGDDLLLGGAGDDSLAGGEGRDTIAGEAGADAIAGGAGDDSLAGGEGADTIAGEAGADAIAGGAGDDSLAGGEGSNRLSGGEGADTLVFATGDTVEGEAGSDEFVLLLPDLPDAFRPVAVILDFSLAEDLLCASRGGGSRERIALEDWMADDAGQIRLDLDQDGRAELLVTLRLHAGIRTAPGDIALSVDVKPFDAAAAKALADGPSVCMVEAVVGALVEVVAEETNRPVPEPGSAAELRDVVETAAGTFLLVDTPMGSALIIDAAGDPAGMPAFRGPPRDLAEALPAAAASDGAAPAMMPDPWLL